MPRFCLHVLMADPLIVATYSGPGLGPAAARLAAMANGAAAHLLVRPSWYGPEAKHRMAGVIGETRLTAPNISFTVMNATASDDIFYRRAGLNSIYSNHNAFLDERIFRPDPNADKPFTAVYAGRLSPEKHHELAAEVPAVAVVTAAGWVEEPYALACIAGYKDLRYVNYAAGSGVRLLPAEDVRRIMTQSRCGLAVTAKEGAMYASAEYLLCGLPVVTIPSLGGRDEFFHPDYVETVEPDPASVAAGVARVVARAVDPLEIHRRTVELFQPHRGRLIMWLSGIVQQNLFPIAGENRWLPAFNNKLETMFDY